MMRSGARLLRFRLWHLGLLGGAVSLCTLGCGSDTTAPTVSDPAHLYWQLTLNYHAITMAVTGPSNTLQLTAIPHSALGTLLPDTGKTTWTVANADTNVTISAAGLLRAVTPVTGDEVIASYTIGNVTHADTAIVNVNAVSPVPSAAVIVFQPTPGDSAGYSVDDGTQNTGTDAGVQQSVQDHSGNTLSNVAIHFTSSDTAVTTYNCVRYGFFCFQRPERLLLYADAMVYGVFLTDTLHYSVGWPLVRVVAVFPQTTANSQIALGFFSPHDDTLAVGGTVVWVNEVTNHPVDVVFDDSSLVQAADSTWITDMSWIGFKDRIPSQGGGNIASFVSVPISYDTAYSDTLSNGTLAPGAIQVALYSARARRFPTAGTYTYHSTLFQTTGVIHVLPEFQLP